MRRLWLRWAGLVVFVVVLGMVFVNLGQWQLDRLDQRRTRNEATLANETKPVRPLAEVFTGEITDADQWQRVEARGTFDGEHQFVVRYRHNGGAEGYEVVTPLRTDAGVVLVDRGFVEASASEIPRVAPPPPSGEVTVVGHVRRNEQGRRAATTPVDGQLRLINSDAIGAVLGYPLLNGYVGLLEVTPPRPARSCRWSCRRSPRVRTSGTPCSGSGSPAIAVAGIVVFIRGDLRARREEQSATEQRAAV